MKRETHKYMKLKIQDNDVEEVVKITKDCPYNLCEGSGVDENKNECLCVKIIK